MMYVNDFTSLSVNNFCMVIAEKIGKNLKEARKATGKTQKEVAAELYMTQQQYSRFENGVFELNYSQILKPCDMFDITPNELFNLH